MIRRHNRDGGRAPQKREPPAMAGRVPPHDLDAEAAVLSAILLSSDALDRVLELLKPEHFYSDANGKVFLAAVTLSAAGTPIDVVSVASWLRDREWLPSIGGPSYLAQLSDATPAYQHVASHATVVYEKWRLRQLIATCQRVAAEGYGDVGDTVQAFIDGAEQAIYALSHSSHKSEMTSMREEIIAEFNEMTAASNRGQAMVGHATGFDRLDDRIAGLSPGDVTLMAGRPGMGKSSAAMNIAVNMASPRTARAPSMDGSGTYIDVPDSRGYGVCVFSLEMPKRQLRARLICSEARVDFNTYRKYNLKPDEWRRVHESSNYLTTMPLWLDDTPAISLLEIRAKVRRKQAEYNKPEAPGVPEQKVGLVVIDYLQLMSAPDDIENREQQIGYISRGLKQLAKELQVPVLALAQLNRSTETRSTKDKRPAMSDLRESGSLEMDADNIVLLYRDEYYTKEKSDAKGLAEWIVAKARNGAPGTVMTRFSGYCTRFDNLSAADYPEHYQDD